LTLPVIVLIIIIFLFVVGVIHPVFWFLCVFVSLYSTYIFTAEFPNTLWAFIFLSFGIMLLVVTMARISGVKLGLNPRRK